jgi:tetratricopeptide (TPR) repeat protein
MALENSILEPTTSVSGAPLSLSEVVESIFAQAKSDYLLTQFSKALLGFRRVLHATENEPHSRWRVESLIFMARIFQEQENGEELKLCVHRLQELQARPDLPAWIHAKIFYIFGVLAYAETDGMSKAMQRFRKSIDLCVVLEERETLAYAMYGVANVFYGLNEYDRALEELDKLDQILHFHSVPDIHVFSLILRAFIARNRGLAQNALALTRQACEHLRLHPNMYLYLQTLYALGSTYLKMEDLNSAQIYLELGKISCSPQELPRTYRVLEKTLQECRKESANPLPACEIRFNVSSGWFERAGMGRISLNGQFVLRDLLALFLENPGMVFSKEELVQKIWSEEYSPDLHDNKIYVTLKRLRQALQPLFPDVDSILRSRNGYSFNHRLFTFTLTGSEISS